MGLTAAPKALGRAVNDRLGNLVGQSVLLVLTLRALVRRPWHGLAEARRVATQQVIFTGYDGLPLIGLIALSIGVIVVMNAVFSVDSIRLTR